MDTLITLIFRNGPLKGQQTSITEPGQVLLGRASDCDVRFSPGPAFPTVSRHHCLLQIAPPVVRVRDLGSLNGTFLNGLPLRPEDDPHSECWHRVEDGDEIRLADYTLEIQIPRRQSSSSDSGIYQMV
jgi:pSer/pThr/pTyr-binding forkhead associated (FHA) protein